MEPGSGLRRSPWPAVGLVSAIAVTLALLVAVLGGLDGFTPHFGTAPSNLRSLDRSAALGELTAGTVRLDYGAARLTIRGEDLGADLYRAHFEVSQDVNATADVDRASGTVAVKLNTLNRPCVFGCRRTARRADRVVELARRPVLFGLLRGLAEAWPGEARIAVRAPKTTHHSVRITAPGDVAETSKSGPRAPPRP